MHIETLLAHSGCEDNPETGAVIAPIHMSTTYHRDADGSYSRGYIYGRDKNPTRTLFEQTLASIEQGETCAAFSSGMAAVSAIFQALNPGDHVLLPDDVYHGVSHVAKEVFGAWGLTFAHIDMSRLHEIERHITADTRLIWLETPSNPMLKISDIKSIASMVDGKGIKVVVDGTWTTPLLQKPIHLGADLVVHSVTKYLGGHSDVLGGAIVSRLSDPFFDRIRIIQKSSGGVMDPFSAWLALRGMRSLAARMRVQCENTRNISNYLLGHSDVARVHYPGLDSHAGHAIATRQMEDFGAMLSFEIKGDEALALSMAASTKVFKRATSLGGTESLIEHRASIEPAFSQTPRTLLRLSIGLEHIDDLIHDLQCAFDNI